MTNITHLMTTFVITAIYRRLLLFMAALLLMPVALVADDNVALTDSVASDTTEVDSRPLLVVLNSYNEARQGVIDIEPVVKAASEHKVRVNLEHIEIARVRNDSIYDITANALFDKYSDEKPDYVVIVGGMGTTFIDRIRQEWGDQIPIVFVGVTEYVGDRDDYYTGTENFVDYSTWQHIDSVYTGANLLYVSQPYFPEKTVDLMAETISGLKEIVFIGDDKWINRYLENKLRTYIKEKYPKLNFRWMLCNSAEKREEMDRLIADYKKGRGLLLSTWSYERPSLLGFPVLVTQDYNSIATSPNPIFALTPMYLQLGAVGGHFYDEDIFSHNIRSAIDHLVTDSYLDTIPNITVERGANMINYDRYVGTRHAFEPIPDDVEIINEPPSFWERYKWIIIIALIVIASIMLIMHIVTRDQRAKAKFFKQLDTILQGMPVAFMTVDVKLDENNRIISSSFEQTNERYRDVILENNLAIKKGKFYEDTRDLLVSQVQAAFDAPDNKAVTYTKYFPRSGKTYEWLFKRDPQLPRCYVYGVDISELAASRRNLAATKSQLEIALLSARLIPWVWDIAGKRLAYDRIRATQNRAGSVGEVTVSRRGYIDNRRLVNLIHPDDRIKLARNFNELASGKIKRWEGYMRIADTTASVPGLYHNARITALALETDENGRVLTISGALLIDKPIEENHAKENAVASSSSQAAIALGTGSSDIVIVEPYESNYILYDAILSKKYTTHRVSSADETRQLLADVVPGLVIINIDTEDEEDIMSILDTIHSRYPDVPAVAITSHATSLNTVDVRIRRSFVSVLTLPVTPSNLMGEISRLLHH
ncbi:MAG: hypothetical protein K2J97_02065 [Muribaculaceae bacterium]|nr:hypothetical protein [Muribaculaceae bacterium]